MLSADYVFFKFINNKLILWDYLNKRQYEVTPDYINEMYDYFSGEEVNNKSTIINELIKIGAITNKTSEWGWDCLSHIFHFGTKNAYNSNVLNNIDLWNEENDLVREKYLSCLQGKYQEITDKKYEKRLELSDISSGSDIELLLKSRKTTREFIPKSIEFKELETILTLCFKSDHHFGNENKINPFGKKKTSPSGGSIHPTQLYIIPLNVDNIETNIYFYDDVKHELCLHSEMPNNFERNKLVGGQPYSDNAACLFILTSRFDLSWIKYKHSRCYRVSLIDIGHVSQTIQLVTSYLGIGSWITGQISENYIEQLFNFESEVEAPMFLIAVGHTTGNSFPNHQ